MNSPPPDFLDWAFWIKDSASVRDLLISIVAVIGIPFLIWRDFSTHRIAKAAVRQADTTAERHGMQTQADQDRRITDNFIKAVEMLGSDKLEARLGAIYALERIARESKRDHWPIMETLTAYVRTKSPAPIKSISNSRSIQDYLSDEVTQHPVANPVMSLPVDIQSALTVLIRRNVDNEEEDQRLNLSGADLSGADLRDANLIKADLTGTILISANLARAKLINAWLAESNLYDAFLIEADFHGADLRATNLCEVDLFSGNLREASLHYANLRGARMYRVDLGRAMLNEADLNGAILKDANLEGTVFCKTIMPDGTLNNRDCPPEPAPPNPSGTPPVPD